jgi:hypothetical protein
MVIGDSSPQKRDTIGEHNAMAKLSAADVIAIRASKLPGVVLAKNFNVSTSLVFNIRHRLCWKHV